MTCIEKKAKDLCMTVSVLASLYSSNVIYSKNVVIRRKKVIRIDQISTIRFSKMDWKKCTGK